MQATHLYNLVSIHLSIIYFNFYKIPTASFPFNCSHA